MRCHISVVLIVAFSLGCGRSVKQAPPPSVPEGQIVAEASPAAAKPPTNSGSAQAEQALAAVEEAAKLAEAAIVNKDFKPIPRPALAYPEEYDLACAILEAPLNDKPKAAYADLLEKKQDPRATYLRRWLDAHVGRGGEEGLKQLEQLGATVPESWIDVLGLSLWVNARRSPLAGHADKMLGMARPSRSDTPRSM